MDSKNAVKEVTDEVGAVNTPIMTPEENKKNAKVPIVGMITLGILAAAGIAFGIFAFADSKNKANEITSLKAEISELKNTTNCLKPAPDSGTNTNTDNTDTNSDTNTNTNDTVSDEYIYISQWGIKIKKPANLTITKQQYTMGNGYSSASILGTDCSNGRCQYLPAFADIQKNNSTLGAVVRVDKDSEYPYGTKVTTIGNYDYYYSGPQDVYSTDEAEKTWEVDTVNLIKQMLTTPNNYAEM